MKKVRGFFFGLYLPVREVQFWVIQFMVLLIAALHYLADITKLFSHLPIPNSETVGLLLIPVAYAGIKYGLKGSVGTAIWSVIMWLPDLMLPDDKGETWADIVELLLVIGIAIFVGIRINKERQAKLEAMFAESQQKEMETRYRILFESNPAPTMLLNSCDVVAFANPAAFKVLGNDIIGVQVEALIEFIEHEDGDHHDDLIAKIFDDDFDREFRVVMTKLTEIEFPQTRNFSFALGEISAVNNAVTQITMFDVTPQTRLAKVSHDYAVSLIKVQEEERKRIALELHDDTIQKLINISQKLQLATYDSADEMKLQLNDLYDTTVNTIGDLRRIATGLRPSILDDFGFAVALKIWIAELVDADKIKLNIVGKPLRLNSDAELNLFRVVQEAISNSVKHSGANNLFVEVSFSPELVRICIKDDGIGFDSKKIHFGMGVLGMEERIKMLNGKFKISSLLDQGTLIEVMVDVTDKLKA